MADKAGADKSTADRSEHPGPGDPAGSPPMALSLETLTAQGLGHIDPTTRSLVPPIYPSTTYERDPDGGYRSGRGYTRPHNPTYDEPEDLLKALEGGSDCLLLASGMAAATTIFQSLLPGDHVVAPRVMYWALRSWLVDFAIGWGLDVEFVDTSNLDALAAAMRPGHTRMVWVETPANPTWDVTDISAAANLAHRAGALLAVDSTVPTPVLTRPIELGADLVMHSATKYLNGHSDVLAGAIVTAHENAFWNRIKACRRDGGAVLGPFEAWLLLRGMRTLFTRVRQSSISALALARHFRAHPKLSVLYPGLPDHPGHQVAKRQMDGGFGGMLSIRHRHGEAAAVETAARVSVFKRATSLGGIESLIEHRASIEGPSTPVPTDLLRLSVGLERVEDLIDDLEQALDHDTGSNSALAGSRESANPSLSQNSAADAIHSVPKEDSMGGDGYDTVERIRELLNDKVHMLVADRGCELTFESFVDGTVNLTVSGSPGGPMPARRGIENLLRHYVPEVESVQIGSPGKPSAEKDESTEERITHLLEQRINPAVAGHGGRVVLDGVSGDIVQLRLEGRCQGCAMASVTLRQGVEVILREHIPELVAVVDVTDHQAGTNPFFKTKKGGQ